MSDLLPAGWVISTYATVHERDDDGVRRGLAVLQAVASWPQCCGIELPVDVTGPRYDALEVLRRTPERTAFVLTTLPLTMDRRAQDPAYGLASADHTARSQAVQDLGSAVACARTFQAAGRNAAIHIYSAPGVPHADPGALARSLSEIAKIVPDIPLMLEHCDSPRTDVAAVKGFLTIGEETAAVASSGTSIQITVNWGRSAIEARNSYGPLQHISHLLSHGMLGGLVFSGCSDRLNAWGPAWCDEHLPPSADISGNEKVLPPVSTLLTQHAVSQTVMVLTSPPVFFGMKVAPPRNKNTPTPLVLIEFLRLHLQTLCRWIQAVE